MRHLCAATASSSPVTAAYCRLREAKGRSVGGGLARLPRWLTSRSHFAFSLRVFTLRFLAPRPSSVKRACRCRRGPCRIGRSLRPSSDPTWVTPSAPLANRRCAVAAGRGVRGRRADHVVVDDPAGVVLDTAPVMTPRARTTGLPGAPSILAAEVDDVSCRSRCRSSTRWRRPGADPCPVSPAAGGDHLLP